jgi:TonB-dependent receptor
MKKTIHITFLACSIILMSFSLFAQTSGKAKITGTITDAVTGEPLIGASVAVQGTSVGAATDLEGKYVLYDLSAGTHTLKFRYLGYQDQTKTDAEVSANETLVINVQMSPSSFTGEEVIITVQARGQMAAINQERSSNQIVNVVASDRIREVPDANAAESIGRLPGVSLQRSAGEGNKVVIRGLSPKYSVIEMDGVRMEGTGMDRSVGLSSVSSESLAGIELSKSLTADKDADAIGGIVNMRTRTAEEGFQMNLNSTGGYNTFNKSYKNYTFNGSVGNRFFDNKFGVLLTGGIERVNRSSDDFSASYGREITTEGNWLYTKDGQITQNLRDRYRSNAGLVLDYKNDFMKIKFNNMLNVKHDDNERRNAKYLFQRNRFDFNNSRSTSDDAFQMHAISTEWKFWNTTLEADYSFSKSKYNGYSDLYYFEDKNSYSGANMFDQNELRERHPDELIMESNALIKIENSAVDWNHRDEYLREDISQTLNINWSIPFRFGDVSGKLKTGYRHKKKDRMSDRQSKELYFFGGIGSGRRQIVEGQIFPDYDKLLDAGIAATGLAGTNFEDTDYDYGNFLNGRYQFPYAVDLDKLTMTFDRIYSYIDKDPDIQLETWQQERGIQSNEQDYSTTEELNAGYVMAEINIGKRIMLLPGLRYENINTEYTSRVLMTDMFDPTGINTPDYPDTVTSYRENDHFFPSVNMKVDVYKWMDVRAAYYKSASRPNFIDLSPFMITDDGLDRLRVKNPYLKPALAHNFDLGVSFFTGRLGLLTVNGFYKKINGLPRNLHLYKLKNIDEIARNGGTPESVIESLTAPISLYDSTLVDPKSTSIYNMPINNPNPAEYAGFELSWQTNLWYLPGLWRGLVLDLNYSMLWSRTKIPYFEYVTVIDSSGFFPIETSEAKYAVTGYTRMLDQPEVLFNAKIGWDYRGFSSRVSFRYQASTITAQDARYHLTDAYNKNMFRIDVNIKQNITPRLSVSLDGTNLTNYIDDRVINNYVGDRDFSDKEQMYGMGIRLGIRYEL